MSFLYPQVLFGLFALAIPIIIHLFNFRKAKRILFSNTQFLQVVKKESTTRLKIRHLLVLLARLLFIFFLVVAFAQPYFPDQEEALTDKSVLIYLDNSLSMSNLTDQDISALTQGVRSANQVLNRYPRGTRFVLLTNDFAAWSNFPKSKEEVEEKLTELEHSYVRRPLMTVLGKLANTLVNVPDEKVDVYLISDFQRTNLTGNTIELADQRNYRIIPIGFQGQANVFVDSAYLRDPYLTRGVSNELVFRIRNVANRPIQNVGLKLFINGNQVANSSVDIAAQASETIPFVLNYALESINDGMLSLDDFPVTFDNDFHFNLNLTEQIKVLEITGTGITQSPLPGVFGNQDLFEFSSYASSNVDYNAVNQSDLVVLNGVEPLDEALLAVLQTYLDASGAIAYIPAAANGAAGAQRLGAVAVRASETETMVGLARVDQRAPFFRDVFDEGGSGNFTMPDSKRLITWRGGTDLIRYKDGPAFLSLFNRRGNLWLFAAPLQTDYSAFQNHALFVPVMYRMAIYSKGGNNRLSYSLDERAILLDVDSLVSTDLYKLVGNGGEVVPEQRIVNDQLLISIPSIVDNLGFTPGQYRLVDNNGTVKKAISFNLNAAESEVDQVGQAAIADLFGGNQGVEFLTPANSEAAAATGAFNEGLALWKYALLLALFFLFAEILLIRLL